MRDSRRIVGPDAVIGVSTHNLEQLQKAVLEGATYVGVGPTFPSSTKEFSEFAGLEYVKQASSATTLPAFVLGGVNIKNVHQIVEAGGRRIAVGSAIGQSDDPRAAAAALRAFLP